MGIPVNRMDKPNEVGNSFQERLEASFVNDATNTLLNDLKAHPLTSRDKLHQIGERVKNLSNETSKFAPSLIEESTENIISLYGKIHSLQIDRRVEDIVDDAYFFAKSKEKANSIAKNVILEKIDTLVNDHRLSVENLKFIHYARSLLNESSLPRMGDEVCTYFEEEDPNAKVVSLFPNQISAKQTEFKTSREYSNTISTAEDLWSMCDAFANGNTKGVFSVYNKLDRDTQRKINEELEKNNISFDKLSTVKDMRLHQILLKGFVMAALTIANQISGVKEEITSESLDQILKDLRSLSS